MGYTSAFHLALGVLIYFVLSSLPKVESFKLFNVVGLAFDILGVLLLSKLIAKSAEKHIVLLDYFYAFIYVAVICVPLGVIFGNLLFFWLDLSSSGTVVTFASSIFAYVAAPLFITEYSGEIFKFKFYESVSSRVIFMGWYLLIAGLALQMAGAIMDLTA